jgi:hypothetical protein
MNLPLDKPITTNILRHCYERGDFSFGNPKGAAIVVLVGSCRIVPFLNILRVYNELRGFPLELLCFDPVEMWGGPGHEVADGVNRILSGYRFDRADYLVCEHVQYCGVLNTVRSSEQNIFASLGCAPVSEIRLPNWNDMHLFDAETAKYDPCYAVLQGADRPAELRRRSDIHKNRFLSHCRLSSFPDLAEWTEANWLTTRLGWTSSHPSIALTWRMYAAVAGAMGIAITPELSEHPLCSVDTYRSTGTVLNAVDYEANGWIF